MNVEEGAAEPNAGEPVNAGEPIDSEGKPIEPIESIIMVELALISSSISSSKSEKAST